VTEPVAGRVAEGGCRCGAIRLRAYGRADAGIIYCHCRDCRKSSGAPVSPFAGYGSEQVETEQGMPKVYESSHGVRRSFCGDCGTPLSYEDERLPGEVYIMVWSAPSTTRSRSSRRCTIGSPGSQSDSILLTIRRGTGRAANPVNPSGRGIEVLVGGSLGPGGFVR
jgi:hypothetical protein